MSIINEPSLNFHLKLNDQQFRIPSELIKKNIEQCQELIERDSLLLTQLAEKLYTSVNEADITVDSLDLINEIIQKVDQLERKIEKHVNIEFELLKRIEKRIEFYQKLKEIKKQGNQDSLISWYQSYTNVLIGDYLIRNSVDYDNELKSVSNTLNLNDRRLSENLDKFIKHVESKNLNPGIEFLKQQNLDQLLDSNVLLAANIISKQLVKGHDLSLLIAWIVDNKTYLKDNASSLEFEARFQQYIEFVREENYAKAVEYFQTYLVKFIYSNSRELKIASGLLVFIKNLKSNSTALDAVKYGFNTDKHFPNVMTKQEFYSFFFLKRPHKSTPLDKDSTLKIVQRSKFNNTNDFMCYLKLLDSKRWENLKEMFLREYYSMYGISYHDPLLIYLSLGISVLKTKDCLHTSEYTPTGNDSLDKFLISHVMKNSCPVCSKEFTPIAKDLPYAHQIHSKLFDNPIMLRNGNIYDSEKLKLLATTLRDKDIMVLPEGQILDPIEKKVYPITDFITMYPT